jgi:PTH2 family peptidyl-tRNA hydrolase
LFISYLWSFILSNYKQVILVREDLKMRKGKAAAQVAHASLDVFTSRSTIKDGVMSIKLSDADIAWLSNGYTKINLGVSSEEDLLLAYKLALESGIPCSIIIDSGKTEFHGVPTKTTCAIGPFDSDQIDKITGPAGLVKTRLI